MKYFLLFFLSPLCLLAQTESVSLNEEEFKILENVVWKGELTYRNYSDDKMVSIPVFLRVNKTKTNTWELEFTYPNEPKANSKSTFRLKKAGTFLNKQEIISKEKKEDGSLQFVTSKKGKDNNKPAEIQITYSVSENSFWYEKKVKPNGESEFAFRNKYSFTKQ